MIVEYQAVLKTVISVRLNDNYNHIKMFAVDMCVQFDLYRIWLPVCPPPSDWVWRGAVEELCPASSDRRTPPPPAPQRLAAGPTVSLHSCRVTHTYTHTERGRKQMNGYRWRDKMKQTFFYTNIAITKKKSLKHYGETWNWKSSRVLHVEVSHLRFLADNYLITDHLSSIIYGEDLETHLRLDRGVYGGVGFSRDLSLRESGERDGMRWKLHFQG